LASLGCSTPLGLLQFHFLPDEPLHPLKEELLLWASWPGPAAGKNGQHLVAASVATTQDSDRRTFAFLAPSFQMQDMLKAHT